MAVLAIRNPDKLPSPVQRLVVASRSLKRQNSPSAGAYYSNCAEARAAGVAPLYSDEPGYRPELDADDDGIACEPYTGR